jgi:prepilin-type N-terminal cleavage/methylation domain-containing protein/prepilin-type processing-associated H-X9-DG protein
MKKNPKPTCCCPTKRKGFTLIELLVVIAIISLLVSILVPSLQKAKALTRQVICLTRLKSLGSALAIYQADYEGRGPVGFTYGGSAWTGSRPPGIFSDPVNYPNPYDITSVYEPAGWFSKKDSKYKFTSQYGGGLFWGLGEYVGRKGHCVRDDGGPSESPVTCPDGIASSMGGTRAGYSVNYYLGYDTFLGDYANNPANNPMLMDGSTDGVPNNWEKYLLPRNPPYPWWATSNPTSFRLCSELTHGNGANYLFFDGHAENHIAPDIEDLSDYLSYYWNLWGWFGD